IMRQLYEYNTEPSQYSLIYASKHSQQDPAIDGNWAGPILQRLLYLAYTLAFTCLLRIDELLKITMDHVELDDEYDPYCKTLKLTLPFWKTNQYGC
ncbi:hypothetical protein P691DRAFT_626746, partial [Macrolepiota fuliginosa MF-IS2]